MTRPVFDPIEDAIAAIDRGEIVVVADDEDRENVGDLIMAADLASEERIAFVVPHTPVVITTTTERVPLHVTSNTDAAYHVHHDPEHGRVGHDLPRSTRTPAVPEGDHA